MPKGTAVESIALKYNIPSRYKVGERIDPQVELWCGGELVGTFPMEYTVETYAPVEDVPKDDVTTAGSGSVVLTVLKWIFGKKYRAGRWACPIFMQLHKYGEKASFAAN